MTAAPPAGAARRHRPIGRRPSRSRRSSSIDCRGPHRPDVRDDQREAHEAERSHLVTLSGRQLYRDDNLATATMSCAPSTIAKTRRCISRSSCSASAGGVAQAPLAQELKRLLQSEAFGGRASPTPSSRMRRSSYVNYFRQVRQVFGGAWSGRKYSIKSALALRAFYRWGRTSYAGSTRSTRIEPTPERSARDCPMGRAHGDLRFETDRRLEAKRHNGRGTRQRAADWRSSTRRGRPSDDHRAPDQCDSAGLRRSSWRPSRRRGCLVRRLQPIYDDRTIEFDERCWAPGRMARRSHRSQSAGARGGRYDVTYTKGETSLRLTAVGTRIARATSSISPMSVASTRCPSLLAAHALVRVRLAGRDADG